MCLSGSNDVAGWTLPLQMGIASAEIKSRFDTDLKPIAHADAPAPDIAAAGPTVSAFLLDHNRNDRAIAVNRLMKGGHDVYWAAAAFTSGGHPHPAGTIIVPARGARQAQVRSIAQALSLPLASADQVVTAGALKLTPLRLALYNPWGGNMDEGWSKLLLDLVILGHKEPRGQRGNPRIAAEQIARTIIMRIAGQSAAFGTVIDYEDGVGVWRPGAAPRRRPSSLHGEGRSRVMQTSGVGRRAADPMVWRSAVGFPAWSPPLSR